MTPETDVSHAYILSMTYIMMPLQFPRILRSYHIRPERYFIDIVRFWSVDPT
jgi:hypothetical protein